MKRTASHIVVMAALGLTLALAGCGEGADEASVPPASGAAPIDGAVPAIPVMGPERRIVAFGDSLFAGYGFEEPGEDSYPARLEAALRARGIDARVTNAGVSGDTSAAGRQRLEFVLEGLAEKPDLFILELGGNDLLRGLSPQETRANLSAMLDELRRQDIPVLIMGMRAPPNYGPEFVEAFDRIYFDLAREYDAELIAFWLESIYDKPGLFQDDRIHPTLEGIDALVGATVDDVAAALPEPEEAEAAAAG